MKPPKAPVPPLPVLRTKFEDMIAFVREADRQAAAGEVVALETLDRDVARFCDLMTRAKPDVSQAVAPLMAELVSALEDLAHTLRRQCGLPAEDEMGNA